MSSPTTEPRFSRNRILLLSLLADIVGAAVIFGMLPIGWVTSLVVFAVFGTAVYLVSQALRQRAGGR